MIVTNSLSLEPFYEKWKVLGHLFSIEDPVYRMAAEKPHLYFVSYVAVYVLILMNMLKDVRCR